jgi:UDP-N-acetyl-D-mannosaminuronate dehydrogenase
MPKFLKSKAHEQYKKRLIKFSQKINPKQPREVIEKKKAELRKERE